MSAQFLLAHVHRADQGEDAARRDGVRCLQFSTAIFADKYGAKLVVVDAVLRAQRLCGPSRLAPLGGGDAVASDVYEDHCALVKAGPIADYNRLLPNELLRFGGRREDKRRAVYSFLARHRG